MVAMTIESEQKTTAHREANGSHDDLVALKVDVATIKEQCKNFATKEDIAKLETKIAKLETHFAEHRAEIKEDINQLLNAFNLFATRVIVVLVSVMVALLGMVATALF